MRFWKPYKFYSDTVQKMKFSIEDFFIFTEKIINEKLHFLCNVMDMSHFGK